MEMQIERQKISHQELGKKVVAHQKEPQPIENRWLVPLRRFITMKVNEIPFSLDEDFYSRAESKIITDTINEYEEAGRIVKKENSDKILKRGQRYPLPWMTKDRELMASFKRKKLIEVLNLLDGNSLNMTKLKNQDLINERYISPKGKKKVKHLYSLVLVDDNLFAKVQEQLELSRNSFQAYLQSLCELGFIKQLKRLRRGPMVYADGYISDYRNKKTKKEGSKKISFMQKKHRAKLLSFRMHGEKF